MKTTTKLWIGLAVLSVFTPLGLIIPYHLKADSAWGEWGAGEIAKMTGYVPAGFVKISGLWKAPIPEYAFKGWQNKGLAHLSLAYICSAVIGIAVIIAVSLLLGRMLTNKDKN